LSAIVPGENGMSANESLSGRWTGVYFYPVDSELNANDAMPPTPFTADISEVAGLLAGRIEEPNLTLGPGASGLVAVLSGERRGETVRFDKQYVSGALRHAVAYDGRLSGDGTTISGRWSIPGDWSGEFRMQRTGTAVARGHERAAAA
jgi:hypothetical protein